MTMWPHHQVCGRAFEPFDAPEHFAGPEYFAAVQQVAGLSESLGKPVSTRCEKVNPIACEASECCWPTRQGE